MLEQEIIARCLGLNEIGLDKRVIYGNKKGVNGLNCSIWDTDDGCGTGDVLLDIILDIDTSNCRNDHNDYYDDDDDIDDDYNNYDYEE